MQVEQVDALGAEPLERLGELAAHGFRPQPVVLPRIDLGGDVQAFAEVAREQLAEQRFGASVAILVGGIDFDAAGIGEALEHQSRGG